MPAQSIKSRARFVGAAIVFALSASVAHAEPPRQDMLKMRSAHHASKALPTLSPPAPSVPSTDPELPQPAAAEPAPAQPAASAADAATIQRATQEAARVLELCYELARRSDTSLKAPVTVQASVRADGSVELRAALKSLGKGYLARCVERKLTALVPVKELPAAADATTQTIVLGATPPTR